MDGWMDRDNGEWKKREAECEEKEERRNTWERHGEAEPSAAAPKALGEMLVCVCVSVCVCVCVCVCLFPH